MMFFTSYIRGLTNHCIIHIDYLCSTLNRLHQMEQEILQKEEEMFSQAVTTRCLSCGQLPPDASKVFAQSHMGRKPANTFDTADGSIEAVTDNDATGVTTQDSSSVQLKVRSEDVYTLLTGSAGLKPLLQQQKPMSPKDPYGYSAKHIMPQNKLKNSAQGKIPEQRYRKAQMAAHLKEMIKVTPAASQNYGFNTNNPFYAGDNLTLDLEERSQGVDSLHSRHPILKANHTIKGRPSTTQASGYASLEGPIYIAVPSSLQSKSQLLTHKQTDNNTVQLPAINQS